jgi:hypothetical protein
MSRDDPKPGRWILPLIVVGIIGFTYVFVTSLPPAPVAATTTTLAAGGTTTTAPPGGVTTTTVPPEIATFLTTADTVLEAASTLGTEAQNINDTWDAGGSFSAALNSLRDLASRTSDFAQSVADAEVPETLTTDWDPVRSAAGDMVEASSDMVSGLQAPDTGQARRAALERFQAAVSTLVDAVNSAKSAAGTAS